MRLRIALAVALPGVEDSRVVDEVARLLRPLLAARLGMRGVIVGVGGVGRAGRDAPRPWPRPRPLPCGVPAWWSLGSLMG